MSPITITVGADGVVTVNGHNVTDKGGTGQVQALMRRRPRISP